MDETLIGDELHFRVQSYLHATYSDGSICESGLSVHDSHSNSFVDESLGMQPNSYFHATYNAGISEKAT